jgi:hypothetical protein
MATRLLRVVLIGLIFALVGPLIGGVTVIMMLAAVSMGPGASPADLMTALLFSLIYGIAFAYLLGIVPAALVGLILGIRQVFFGRVSWGEALGLGLVAGMIFMILIARSPSPDTAPSVLVQPILVLACVIPTMVCWAIVRSWFVKPPAPSA